MSYKIEFSTNAYKYLVRLDKTLKTRIYNQLLILCENPRNSELAIKKLKGYRALGNYRILYSVEDTVLIINVIKIGSRGDVYNDL